MRGLIAIAIAAALAACSDAWTAKDATSARAVVHDMSMLEKYCAPADAGICTPAFVRAVAAPAVCSAKATLHRHRIEVDAGANCRPTE